MMCERCGYEHSQTGAKKMWRVIRKQQGFSGYMQWKRKLSWDRGMVAKYRNGGAGWDFYNYGAMIHMFVLGE